jgi:hypothetical protein
MRGPRFLFASFFLVTTLPWLAAAPSQAAWPHDPNVNVPICTAANSQQSQAIAPDSVGGAIVVWYDLRGGTGDIYAQRLSADGAAQWTADGVVVCGATSEQAYPVIAPDGGSGAIVVWRDYRNGNADIYAQRVSADGVPQWSADGVALCLAAADQTGLVVVSDGAGGAIVVWQDSRNGNQDVYAQRVSADGVALWTANGVALSTSSGDQQYLKITSDGAGGAVVAWQDNRSGVYPDVYAQRISAAGATLWTAGGVAVCAATNAQSSPVVAPDGAGGAIFAWYDYRGGSNYDIYAQRVSAAGGTQWTTNGVAVCTATGTQWYPVIVADGVGGAIVAWYDYRSGSNYDIYAQRLSGAGAVQWAPNGVALSAATGDQTLPAIASDGGSGAIVTWQDYRGSSNDVYAQRVTSAGAALWTVDGVALCTVAGSQLSPGIAADGRGGAVVAWPDYRSGTNFDIYAQQVERFGFLGDPAPAVVSVGDLPNDQGGRVRIRWTASYPDTEPSLQIGTYGIWRQVTGSAATTALARGARLATSDDAGRVMPGLFRTLRAADQVTWWEAVGTVAARGQPWYTFVAETFQDSTVAANPYMTFMVDAHAAYRPGYWDSEPDSGYSVDNLAPGTPALFTGQYASGTTTLHWQPNGEADMAGYRLYRGTTPDFAPGPGNLVAEPVDTGYVDVAGAPYYYKLCAVDVHGNASGHAVLLPSGVTGVYGPGPVALSLSLGSANPARGGATLRWALPAEGDARLVVYDLAGRVVRELASERAGAGEHVSAWDGRNGAGALAPAGMYVARLETQGRGLSVRFVLVR